MVAVADSGFVIAVAIATDQNHQRCVEIFKKQQKIYLPQSTLAEVCYLLTRAGGNRATAQFLRMLPQTRYEIVALIEQDLQRTAEILEKYIDSRADFVDATIIAVAERLKIPRILTVDRRDFDIIRPTGFDYFEILP